MHKRYGKRKIRRTKDLDDEDEGHSCTSHDDTFSHGTQLSSVSSVSQAPDLTPDRRFHHEIMYADRFSPEDIEVPRGSWVYLACPGSKRKCPTCHLHVAHIDCVVLAIDGACSNNGRTEARSSIGVYCGPGNRFNLAYALDWHDRHTSQLAELEACLKVLMKAITIEAERPFGDLNTIVIKSDSEYVVRGLTEWLPKWKQNGWKNCKGLPVANATKFHMIERLLEQLERDISFKFWLVPRKLNEAADNLAKLALESG